MVSKHVTDGDKCFMCGEDNINVLQSHHIVPSVFGGSDDAYNRVVLCANHHQAIHAIYSDAVFKRLGVSKESRDTTDADVDDDSFEAGGDTSTEDESEPSIQEMKWNLVEKHVLELIEEYDDLPGVPEQKLITVVSEDTLPNGVKMTEEEVSYAIQQLRDKGVVYSPSQEHIRHVEYDA